MAIVTPEVIKKIVRKNFDDSAECYESFEQRYGLFKCLTEKLAKACNIKSGMHVCDIGCGTGTSSFVLQDIVGVSGKVFGIDISANMLALARAKLHQKNQDNQENQKSHQNLNIEFIHCAANEIAEKVDITINSVLYNACIFLIPDYKESLRASHQILAHGGTVGMNYLLGIYDGNENAGSDVNNLFENAKRDNEPFAPYGRQIIATNKLGETLNTMGFKDIHEGLFALEMPLEELQEFFSIPAQATGLWPKDDHAKRLSLLESFINLLKQQGLTKIYQYWGWCTGIK